MLATHTACATRLADLTWQCQRGEFAALTCLLEAQGRRVTRDGPQLTVHGPTMTVTILAGSDPLTCFVQMAFALFGARWAEFPLVRDAMQDVMKTWHRATRAHRKVKQAVTKGGK